MDILAEKAFASSEDDFYISSLTKQLVEQTLLKSIGQLKIKADKLLNENTALQEKCHDQEQEIKRLTDVICKRDEHIAYGSWSYRNLVNNYSQMVSTMAGLEDRLDYMEHILVKKDREIQERKDMYMYLLSMHQQLIDKIKINECRGCEVKAINEEIKIKEDEFNVKSENLQLKADEVKVMSAEINVKPEDLQIMAEEIMTTTEKVKDMTKEIKAFSEAYPGEPAPAENSWAVSTENGQGDSLPESEIPRYGVPEQKWENLGVSVLNASTNSQEVQHQWAIDSKQADTRDFNNNTHPTDDFSQAFVPTYSPEGNPDPFPDRTYKDDKSANPNGANDSADAERSIGLEQGAVPISDLTGSVEENLPGPTNNFVLRNPVDSVTTSCFDYSGSSSPFSAEFGVDHQTSFFSDEECAIKGSVEKNLPGPTNNFVLRNPADSVTTSCFDFTGSSPPFSAEFGVDHQTSFFSDEECAIKGTVEGQWNEQKLLYGDATEMNTIKGQRETQNDDNREKKPSRFLSFWI